MVQFFCMNLKRLGFASQLEDDEQVVESFRRPFSTAMSKIMTWLVLFVGIGYVIWIYLPQLLPNMPISMRWLVILPIIFGAERISVVFWLWYGNAVLMTNESLVFTVWSGFFNRKITRLDYWDLDEVGLERKGIANFLAGVGDVIFEKVSGGDPLIFSGMNRPKRAVKILRQHRGRMLDDKNFTEESALKNLLSQMVQTHVRSDGQPSRDTGEILTKLNSIPESKVEDKPESGDTIEVDFELDDDGGVEIKFED